MAKPTKTKIVAAVMASAGSVSPSGCARAMAIQEAMTEAVKTAQAKGITDPIEIKAAMLAARAAVKAGQP